MTDQDRLIEMIMDEWPDIQDLLTMKRQSVIIW